MPEPRYKPNLDEQDKGYAENPILVYDYAVGGATIDGVKVQVEMFFLGQAGVGTNPDWARWSSEETLFGELASIIPECAAYNMTS